MLKVSINDNGKGFTMNKDVDRQKDDVAGYGLVSMKERAAFVGGSVAVSSQPGKGTDIVITIPFIENAAKGISI